MGSKLLSVAVAVAICVSASRHGIAAATAIDPRASGDGTVPIAQDGPDCGRTSVGLTPLTDLGAGTYQGFTGGIYPDERNLPPADYLSSGIDQAQQVVPRGSDGQPDPLGKVGLLTIGMSNAAVESAAFMQSLRSEPTLNPALVPVNAAQGGFTASMIRDPDDGGTGMGYWNYVDMRVAQARLSRSQVQVVWLKEADAGPRGSDIAYAQRLAAELEDIIGVLTARFPNLKLVYLSSRIYGGYASSPLNPEPYAYASGFAVKWAIEPFIQSAAVGKQNGPWVGWGPYLWADGTTPRGDGLTWSCSDFSPADGTHPSPAGAFKVAAQLISFFETDPTATPWFQVNAAY